MFLIIFLPAIAPVVYLCSWFLFTTFHATVIVRLLLPKLEVGNYPLEDKKAKIIILRLTADQTARVLLTALDFIPVVVNKFLRPFFFRRYQVKLGKNSYISRSNVIDGSNLIEIGDNCVVGQYALICCHIIVGKTLIVRRIRIGNNVTIGAYSLTGPSPALNDTIIEDGVTIGAAAVVPGKHLLAKSTWLPAPIFEVQTKMLSKE
jgi:acetyltransferase-like isoleucine patch superfamily enzyme